MASDSPRRFVFATLLVCPWIFAPHSIAAGFPLSRPSVAGFVIGWGHNNTGQTNIPPNLTNAVAVAAGYRHSLALRADGSVIAWGYNGEGQTNVPLGLSNAVALAAGANHSIALRSDGTLLAWGHPSFGGGLIPIAATSVVAIAAGNSHNLALKSDGTVLSWGYAENGQTNVPAGLTDVAEIGAGGSFSLAIKSNGTVVAWGRNDSNQTVVPFGLSNVIGAAGGIYHTIALERDGSVVTWGAAVAPIPAGLGSVVAIDAGWNHSIALTSSGRVIAWGQSNVGQTNVPSALTNVLAVVAGGDHNLALVPYGSLPVITNQPMTQFASLGGAAMLTVSVAGTEQYSFQWRRNGVAIGGATNSSLILTNIVLSDVAAYDVVVTGANGSTVSRIAYIALKDFALRPVISVQGVPAMAFQIDYANELNTNQWLLLTNGILDVSRLDVIDFTATNREKRYYRILSN